MNIRITNLVSGYQNNGTNQIFVAALVTAKLLTALLEYINLKDAMQEAPT